MNSQIYQQIKERLILLREHDLQEQIEKLTALSATTQHQLFKFCLESYKDGLEDMSREIPKKLKYPS